VPGPVAVRLNRQPGPRHAQRGQQRLGVLVRLGHWNGLLHAAEGDPAAVPLQFHRYQSGPSLQRQR